MKKIKIYQSIFKIDSKNLETISKYLLHHIYNKILDLGWMEQPDSQSKGSAFKTKKNWIKFTIMINYTIVIHPTLKYIHKMKFFSNDFEKFINIQEFDH